MKRIFVPTKDGGDWQALLAQPVLHWKKGKSAMTAAASWEHAADSLPPEISSLLESCRDTALLDLKLVLAIPEWPVALKGGETASHTDVLAIARNEAGLCVIAVEAKVDEDFGPLLGERRGDVPPDQDDRVKYLHSLLGIASLDDAIRYQLLHRTASAVLTAREFHAHAAVMLIHSFGQKKSIREDFESFCRALRVQELPGGMRVVPSLTTPRLFLGWCDGNRQFLSVQLRSAA